MKKSIFTLAALSALVVPLATSCCDTDDSTNSGGGGLGDLTEGENAFGKTTGNFDASEWYPGGQLGTTEKKAYSVSTSNVDASPFMTDAFEKGITFFEKVYTFDQEPRKGLGPAWVRNSCISCHPAYGHGKRQTEYKASTIGNGYLLVIYHPDHATTSDGVQYTTLKSGYISEVTGMPQTQAMHPFKAPVDESQINIEWKQVAQMPSGLSMTFPDGEKYELIYPEVTIPQTAFNTYPKPDNYEVRLESTIGLYGTGLLDAITEEDMEAQWRQTAKYVEVNPNMWDKEADTWASSAWYPLADGQRKIKRFTYAMTRASLQDGAGANAIWNIPNVSRSDRQYLYSTPAWAKAMSMDQEVIDYIAANGKTNSLVAPYYAETNGVADKEIIAQKVEAYLGMNTKAKGAGPGLFDSSKTLFQEAFGEPEMTDKAYYEYMVWHRGLAVPAARDLDDPQVQQGKKVFTEIGCAQCHRPSWTTGADNMWIDNATKDYFASIGKDASEAYPKFPYQTIYPYTDMVQHRLYMENDIRTGWCRTTPLWGRGLSYQLTGAEDRLHDCRARNEIEAIMWHGYSKDSQAFSATKKFYELSKSDRDAVVKFIRAI